MDYFYLINIINIINLKTFCYMAGTNKNDANLYIAFYIVFHRKPARYYISNSFELSYR